jgi:NADH oxidase (H2O2-forming)
LNKLVILGLGSAGFATIMAFRKKDPLGKITVIDDKDFDLFHNCGLPYALEGAISSFENLKHKLELERLKVELVRGKVQKVDTQKKEIILGEKKIYYDSLIISTGARAFIPPIKGAKELLGKSVFFVETIESTMRLQEKAKNSKSAVVIGAGAIGLETAGALRGMGLETTVIEMNGSIFPRALDEDVGKLLEEKLSQKGIKIITSKSASEITEKGVKIEETVIECDLVVLTAGIKPNTEFLEGTGIKTENGFVPVNDFMETSIERVYAAGDVALVKNFITKKSFSTGLATSAYLQGLIAGENAVGGKKKYGGTTSTFVSVLGETEVASAGITSKQAREEKIDFVEAKVTGKNRPEWFGNAKELTIKLIAEKETEKIIGCQTLGENGYVRVNVVSAGIQKELTVNELLETELAYCPPVADTYDLLLVCAGVLKRRIELFKKREQK